LFGTFSPIFGDLPAMGWKRAILKSPTKSGASNISVVLLAAVAAMVAIDEIAVGCDLHRRKRKFAVNMPLQPPLDLRIDNTSIFIQSDEMNPCSLVHIVYPGFLPTEKVRIQIDDCKRVGCPETIVGSLTLGPSD
jgi:hypothetical protein